jgi:hypothetical protein
LPVPNPSSSFELLQGVASLDLNTLGWGDAETAQLAGLLPVCDGLLELRLTRNQIGDAGAIALSHAIGKGSLPALTELNLYQNRIGDDGARALAEE